MSHWTVSRRSYEYSLWNGRSWNHYVIQPIVTSRSPSQSTPRVRRGSHYYYYKDTLYYYRTDGGIHFVYSPRNSEVEYKNQSYSYTVKLSSSLQRIAQNKLLAHTADIYMSAKDLVEGCSMVTKWFKGLASVIGDLKKRNLYRAYVRLMPYLSHKASMANAKRIQKLQRYFYKKKKSRKAVKAYSQAWLEFQWGVKPTVDTIQNLYKQATNYQPSMRVVSRHSETEVWSAGALDPAICTQHVSCTCIRKMHLSTLSFAADWGLTNPVKAIWDGIPYSFLVDWFIPVGDYLNNQLSWPVYSASGCDVFHGTGSLQFNPAYIKQISKAGTQIKRVICNPDLVYYRREPQTRLGIPDYTFAQMLRDSEFGVSGSRALNAFALVNAKR